MIHKFRRIVKRYVTRQEKTRPARRVNPKRQKNACVEYVSVYANGRLHCIVEVA
jgi:hypothetical protein